MANPALGQAPGSVGRPHIALCGFSQHSRMTPLGCYRCCRVGVSLVGLLLGFLQMSFLQSSCPFWGHGPSPLSEDVCGV